MQVLIFLVIKVANFCLKVLNPQVLIRGCLLYQSWPWSISLVEFAVCFLIHHFSFSLVCVLLPIAVVLVQLYENITILYRVCFIFIPTVS